MSKWYKIGLVGLLVFGAVAALVTGVALAQDDTTETPEEGAPYFGRRVFWHSPRDLGGEVGMEAAAEVLGMTADELSTQLWGGKILADIAEEQGVDLADVQAAVESAIQAVRETAQRSAIEQALEDGTITQENADWLLEGLEKGFLNNGFGFGHRMGGRSLKGGILFFGPGGFLPGGQQAAPSDGA